MMSESQSAHSQERTTICQLARLGDLVQMLPLINRLKSYFKINLICDNIVEDWAEQLPGIDGVHTIDTCLWRKIATEEDLNVPQVIQKLHADIQAISNLASCSVFSLNDHPVCDIISSIVRSEDPYGWVNHRLILLRSYLRAIAKAREWNRIHLSDLWGYLAGCPKTELTDYRLSEPKERRGRIPLINQFEMNPQRQTWAFIVGSGGKARRIDPKVFANWWKGVPEDIRPNCVLVGGKAEKELARRFLNASHPLAERVVNLVGELSPAELLALFRTVDLVIGVDTGPLHWAAAVGTRVLGIYFGDAGLHDTGPLGNDHLILTPDCNDYPCNALLAEQCGYKCLTTYAASGSISGLLSSLARSDTIRDDYRFGVGLQLFRSKRTKEGQSYQLLGIRKSVPEIDAFTTIVRTIFNLSEPTHLLDNRMYGLPDIEPSDIHKNILKSWSAAAADLQLPRTIPNDKVTRAKEKARQILEPICVDLIGGREMITPKEAAKCASY
ncbi:hypothetical protein CEE37_08090 [candidate division LCP-89 bacterium B3_LCP]|uniref:Glycosyl transferase n=1 Tax=candidate division LCP-89 bacterium B3_LCP TaxID=2012998 RepID=A0A532UZX3_UNCL8|nr:MAG: hypothetical protein CEE37_08090 [candidate division LCP-89 bacterium B3_LCP]